ncbi:MAG: hypothetical protein PHU85_12990, partial [Phycisphaerae bacterium]|nr:hypothetical protein [Phycisphaerae bacterium]
FDRGTGRMVARANDVVPMPKANVYYIDEWQGPANAIGPNDAVGGQYGGAGLSIRLDVGGTPVQMNIQASMGGNPAGMLAGGTVVKIKFGSGTGKMVVRQYGANNTQVYAVSDDGAYQANAYSQKGGTNIGDRFKDILAGLAERPESTRIWPADARPSLGGVEGWAAAQNTTSDVGLWNPETKQAIPGRPGMPGMVMGVPNMQVYVAARVLHPYELPPGVLTDNLGDAKLLSSKPIEIGEWVGVEKVLQVQGIAQAMYGVYYGMQPQQPRNTTYQCRVLDLHRDVRRLIIRCQTPKDQYGKWSADFDKILKQMRVPAELMEPVVVPLDPATYKGKK